MAKEVETYKAIPYPLPDAVKQRLIEAGEEALRMRRAGRIVAAFSTREIENLEEDIREALGVEATRTY